MGSPDLPPEENTLSRPLDGSLPMHGNITTSDDSDNENVEHLGYQPLAFDDENMEYTNRANNDDMDDEDDDYDYSAFNYPTEAPPTGIVVQSINAEVESEVWNAPRPESSDIVLDSTRTEQIMTAMTNFSLPSTSIPTWAQGVSEDKWKEELLQRIRQRQNTTNSSS